MIIIRSNPIEYDKSYNNESNNNKSNNRNKSSSFEKHLDKAQNKKHNNTNNLGTEINQSYPGFMAYQVSAMLSQRDNEDNRKK